jgi:hypothetical protein
MISTARTNTNPKSMSGIRKIGTQSKPYSISRNQLAAMAVAFGLAAFTVVLISAIWAYVMVHAT